MISRMIVRAFLFLITAGILWTASALIAQQPEAAPDPFGGDVKAPPPTPAPAKKKEVPEVQETDPNVLAIRSSNPRTPVELITAIEMLMNLARPDEAKKYVQVLIDSKPDEQTLANLQRKFGSAIFFRMSTDKGMEPVGRPLAELVLTAGHKLAHDPGRLDALIKQLSDPSPATRHSALVDLRFAEEDAAVALMGVLADANRASEHAVARAALVRLGSVAEGPSIAGLESPWPELREQILTVFSRWESAQIIPYLLRPALTGASDSALRQSAAQALVRMGGSVPTPGAAERFLHRQALAYFGGKLTGKPDHENLIVQWRWDAAQQRPVAERVPPQIASLRMAARLAGELIQLAPKRREYQKLYVAALLETAKLAGGWEKPLEATPHTPFSIAAQMSSEELEELLEFSLANEHIAAAVGALQVIGAAGDIRLLINTSGQPRTVVRSLRHADRRVRLAALEAIRQIDATEHYAGASFVPETIGYFVRASAARRVLVAHPRLEHTQTLVGMLQELGIESDRAAWGIETLQLAMRDSDYEFVLISDAIDRPNALELLQQMRREPRTAKLPVGIMAREANFDRINRAIEGDPFTLAFPPPHDLPGVSFMIGRLVERAGDHWVSPEERLRQAERVLDFTALLAEKPNIYGFYDLIAQESAVEEALATSQLTIQAARVLGLFGTPTAQRSLVTLASQNERPLPNRQAAATAFAVAVKQRGLLLTRDEILVQYDRYNASAALDQGTQQVLGSLLDTIESPLSSTRSSVESQP